MADHGAFDKQAATDSLVCDLMRPTADSRLLAATAVDAVHQSFKTGFDDAKAGVMRPDLRPVAQQQGEIDQFAVPDAPRIRPTDRNRAQLMAAMDELNRCFGRDSAKIGSAALVSQGDEVRSGSTKHERCSPRYTTRWNEMPRVRS